MVVGIVEEKQISRNREGEREGEGVHYNAYPPLNSCERHSLPAEVQLAYTYFVYIHTLLFLL